MAYKESMYCLKSLDASTDTLGNSLCFPNVISQIEGQRLILQTTFNREAASSVWKSDCLAVGKL